MKRIESYLSKYKEATPLWGIFRRDFADYLSNTTNERVLKNQIIISGKKIYLRGVSTSLRSYIKIHNEEVNHFLRTFPEAEHLRL